MSLLKWMSVLALTSVLAACPEDSKTEEGEDLPMPVSEEVSADDGADIETNGAAISIPGGALEDDTTVTLDVILPNGVPDEDSLGSLIYDFGPDGTTFSEPVELTITMNQTLPEGMDAHMAWLDEDADQWVPLQGSRVVDNTVVASTTHFTMFAVIVTGSGQTAGSCQDFADFEACGGDDVEGTWEFALACADISAEDLFGAESPFGDCPDIVVEIEADIAGMVTFEAGGEYQSSLTRNLAFDISIPLSCIPRGATCSDLADEQEGSMPEEVDGNCLISMAEPEETETEMGTYELEGNTLIMSDAADAEPGEPEDYCVQGDVITIRNVSVDAETGQETVMFIVANRQQ
jgi:hypothetical protein